MRSLARMEIYKPLLIPNGPTNGVARISLNRFGRCPSLITAIVVDELMCRGY
jgi:hypothetical protein